jgi:short-subunit dehydrogenase
VEQILYSQVIALPSKLFFMNNQPYALITGATSGIGYELAKLFAQDQYNLVIVSRHQEDLDRVASELGQTGVKVLTLAKDLFQPESAKDIFDTLQEQHIEIDTLVNDAGQGVYGRFVETELERELDIIQLNITSLVTLTKFFLQEMVKRGAGKILNVSSIASKTPGPWQSVYHGTKAFVQSFTEAIRAEVKESGITVTALLPGVTDTDFFNKAEMNASKAVQDKDAMADPADVAKDGYEALMRGDDMVVSGFSNKIQVAMGAVTPDAALAKMTGKKQEPVGHEE